MKNEKPTYEELERENDELRKRAGALSVIFKSAPAHLVHISIDGIIRNANRATYELYGLDESDFVGRHFSEIKIFNTEDIQLHAEIFSKIVSGEQTEPVEFKTTDKNGSERWMRAQTSALIKFDYMEGFVFVVTDITDEKNTHEALRESESEFKRMARELRNSNRLTQEIIDNAESFIYLFDAYGRALIANKKLQNLIGLPRERIIGLKREAFISPEQAAAHRASDLKVIESKEPLILEEYDQQDDGPHTYLTTKFPVMNEQGEIYAVGGISTDITGLKRTGEELFESQTLLSAIINSTSDMIWSVDPVNFGLLKFNNGLRNYFLEKRGIKIEIGMRPEDLFPAEEFVQLWRGLYKRALNEHSYSTEYEVFAQNITLLLRFNLLQRNGEVFGISVFGKDITERKLAEKELRRSEELFRTISELSHNAICIVDERAKITWANERMVEIGGYSMEQILSAESFLDFIDPECAEFVVGNFMKFAKGEEYQHEYTFQIIRADGQKRTLEKHMTDFSDMPGKRRLLISMLDMTERIRAEREVRQSEEKFFRAFHYSPIAMTISTLSEGKYVDVNDEFLRVVERSREEVIGRTPLEIGLYADTGKRKPLIEQLRAKGEARNVEVEIRGKSGKHLTSLLSIDIIDVGNEQCILASSIDITDQKKHEQDMIRMRNIESIGTLAGGIAHDFNNHLGAILSGIDYAMAVHGKVPAECEKTLESTRQSVYDARDLTRQLITFAKGGVPVLENASIADLVKNICTFSLRGSKSKAVLNIEPGVDNVPMDQGQISQVVQNLLLNADQSMPEGGIITITVKNAAPGIADGALPRGKFVEVSVADKGIGIPEEHLSKIFDPYFSTKQKGNGLGLATSFSIVSRHGGRIVAESELGKGSTITFWLPATSGKSAEKKNMATQQNKGTGISVLLMDDNEAMTGKLIKLLRLDGYDAALARDGVEAIGLYKKSAAEGKRFDVVVLDLTIPGGMGGIQTINALKEFDPDVKAIVASGYANDPAMSKPEAYGFVGELMKPYMYSELVEIIDTIAGRREQL